MYAVSNLVCNMYTTILYFLPIKWQSAVDHWSIWQFIHFFNLKNDHCANTTAQIYVLRFRVQMTTVGVEFDLEQKLICSLWETLPCDWEDRGHCICKEMPVVDPKRIIGKKKRNDHCGSGDPQLGARGDWGERFRTKWLFYNLPAKFMAPAWLRGKSWKQRDTFSEDESFRVLPTGLASNAYCVLRRRKTIFSMLATEFCKKVFSS
jgi:hypothetical protein